VSRQEQSQRRSRDSVGCSGFSATMEWAQQAEVVVQLRVGCRPWKAGRPRGRVWVVSGARAQRFRQGARCLWLVWWVAVAGSSAGLVAGFVLQAFLRRRRRDAGGWLLVACISRLLVAVA
jgi:hypothetical protein